MKNDNNTSSDQFTSRNWDKASFEFYATPPEATRALLSVEKFTGDIWEPACGNGAISEVLKASGHIVHSTDLILRGYEDERLDFLKTTAPLARNIITNPPYGKHGLADAFIRKALTHTAKTGGKVAMLLNLRSLAHPQRTQKYRKNPPAKIYILDELTCLPNWKPILKEPRYPKQQYFWSVWDSGAAESTELDWLSPNDFNDA